MESINQLVKEVESSGWLYPRPTSICNICQENLILCWGPKKAPYWKHYRKVDHQGSNESDLHRTAKNLLCKYLNEGHRMKYRNIDDNISYHIPKLNYEEEFVYRKYDNASPKTIRWDIAGLDEKGEIQFGIEIWYQHKIANYQIRNEIPWIEVKAVDIIDQIIKFQEAKIKQLDVLDHVNKTIIEDIDDCAIRLGYLKISDKKYYYLPDQVHWTSKIWDMLISIGTCIKCHYQHRVKPGKPYCYSCYNDIIDGENDVKLD